MVIMSLSLVFKPNGGKNKADPNGTAVRFTATLPGDETAWRSKHARRVIVPSPKFCKQMQLFVLAKQKQVGGRVHFYGLAARMYTSWQTTLRPQRPPPQPAGQPTSQPAHPRPPTHPTIQPSNHLPMHQRQVEASIAKAAEVATKKRGGLSASAAMQSKGKDAQLLENLLALDVWTRQSVSVRKMIAKKCTADLMHAVSDYIGNDPPLLLAICPELREEKICDDGALARWARDQHHSDSHPPTANRKPPTANRQPPTATRHSRLANRQPPTANRLPSTLHPPPFTHYTLTQGW